jgi:predicted N-acetyltransferase YhbS
LRAAACDGNAVRGWRVALSPPKGGADAAAPAAGVRGSRRARNPGAAVRIVEGDPSRLRELADLTERVWGRSADARELDWFYGGNPAGPASVLLGEEDGRVVASVAMTYLRMSVGGEEMKVGMPVHLATDPGYRGRGIFRELQAANEERAREAGARLLFVVPTPVSASVLRRRLGWFDLPPLRVWARLRLLRGRLRAQFVPRFDSQVTNCHLEGSGDRVVRDAAWLNWRFAEGPRRYGLLEGGGYAVIGRRGRLGTVVALEGGLLADAAAVAEGPVLIAAPPPWERWRYALAGYVPTSRAFTLLGKSLDPVTPLPARPHFELGDLDFF